MWLGKSSIRPVPAYARLGQAELDQVREELVVMSEESEDALDDAFAEFERRQPAVYYQVSKVLDGPIGETAQALGYFLSLAVWLAFEQRHGRAMREISEQELDATIELLDFDQGLRAGDRGPQLETDDIVSMQQPDILSFIHEQMEAATEESEAPPSHEDLTAIYRTLLIEVLSLSYCIEPPAGFPLSRSEAQA
jgi:hypothetical protein